MLVQEYSSTKYLRSKYKAKNDMMYQDTYSCICQNTKKKKKKKTILSSMSNLQPNWCLKIDYRADMIYREDMISSTYGQLGSRTDEHSEAITSLPHFSSIASGYITPLKYLSFSILSLIIRSITLGLQISELIYGAQNEMISWHDGCPAHWI